jgi:hypothetical protein
LPHINGWMLDSFPSHRKNCVSDETGLGERRGNNYVSAASTSDPATMDVFRDGIEEEVEQESFPRSKIIGKQKIFLMPLQFS